MATNYVQPGEVVTLTAPSGNVVAGTPYKIGSIVCVAEHSVAQTLPFSAFIGPGVRNLVKVSAQAWTEGVKVYWDDSAKKVTTTNGGNTLIGVAAAVAANPSGTGKVRLDGVAR